MKKYKALSKETTDNLNKYAEQYTLTRDEEYKRKWKKELDKWYAQIEMGM